MAGRLVVGGLTEYWLELRWVDQIMALRITLVNVAALLERSGYLGKHLFVLV